MLMIYHFTLCVKVVIILLLFVFQIYPQSLVRFGAIGDYGKSGQNEEDVANLVKSWNPDFIITLGDNNYNEGSASTIDENIGQYYSEFIFPYNGSYGSGSNINRFFPSIGNHDHNNLFNLSYLQPYLNYFDLMTYSGTSGNERYYDFVWENVHLFVVNSTVVEPDGYVHPSVQSAWLEEQMTNCTTNHNHWRIVYFHHAPYSSEKQAPGMRWPFKEWGAHAVLNGHSHTYERLHIDGLVYFVNGLGGKSTYNFDVPVPGSQIRYNDNYGALLVDAFEDSINFKFYSVANELVDSYTIYNQVTGIEEELPLTFSLKQNYPNPFNPSTIIEYNIVEQGFVSLKVYNTLGSEVATLVEEIKPAGSYKANFIASNLSSGVYYYKLQFNEFTVVKKMLLLK
jgi:tartrate-resistant acid phosphatase type 5